VRLSLGVGGRQRTFTKFHDYFFWLTTLKKRGPVNFFFLGGAFNTAESLG